MAFRTVMKRPFSFMGSDQRQDSGEPEFGTSSGRQGIFDPDDPRQRNMAVARLQELWSNYGNRLDMQYTGETGLDKNDGDGYAKMLNARTEFANINNILGGKAPLGIRSGGTMTSKKPLKGLEAAWKSGRRSFFG